MTGRIDQEIAENSRSGTNVGAPVAATDIGRNGRQETLTYTLERRTDADSFTIVRRTGQIRVKSGITLDHEIRHPPMNTTVMPGTTEPSDENRRSNCQEPLLMVVINVTNVDETPTGHGIGSTGSHREHQ